jgi:hypothetical protein
MVLSMEPHFLLLSNEGQDRFGVLRTRIGLDSIHSKVRGSGSKHPRIGSGLRWPEERTMITSRGKDGDKFESRLLRLRLGLGQG